jgi:hypothetical protein
MRAGSGVGSVTSEGVGVLVEEGQQLRALLFDHLERRLSLFVGDVRVGVGLDQLLDALSVVVHHRRVQPALSPPPTRRELTFRTTTRIERIERFTYAVPLVDVALIFAPDLSRSCSTTTDSDDDDDDETCV